MAQEVDRVNTPIGPETFTTGMVSAWSSLEGSAPTKESVAVLWGQYMVETGGQAVWNWNIGNVKHVNGDGYDWFDLPGTWEMVNGQKVVLSPGDPGRLFRSYDSLDSGFKGHLSFLKKRYAPAWQYVVDGDPQGFVHALKARRYFTADEGDYYRLLAGHFNNYMAGPYYENAPRSVGRFPAGPFLAVVGVAAALLVAHQNGLIRLPRLPHFARWLPGR